MMVVGGANGSKRRADGPPRLVTFPDIFVLAVKRWYGRDLRFVVRADTRYTSRLSPRSERRPHDRFEENSDGPGRMCAPAPQSRGSTNVVVAEDRKE